MVGNGVAASLLTLDLGHPQLGLEAFMLCRGTEESFSQLLQPPEGNANIPSMGQSFLP